MGDREMLWMGTVVTMENADPAPEAVSAVSDVTGAETLPPKLHIHEPPFPPPREVMYLHARPRAAPPPPSKALDRRGAANQRDRARQERKRQAKHKKKFKRA